MPSLKSIAVAAAAGLLGVYVYNKFIAKGGDSVANLGK